MIKFNTNRK